MHNNDEVTTNEQGGKQSKLEYAYELLEPSWLRDVAHVLYQGKLKYGAKNWQLITDYREHLGRAMYHIQQALEDKDHSEAHFANATCRLMFADWCYKNHYGEYPDLGKALPSNLVWEREPFIPAPYWASAEPGVPVCSTCNHPSKYHHHVSRYNDQTGKADPDSVSCEVCGCQEQQKPTKELSEAPIAASEVLGKE